MPSPIKLTGLKTSSCASSHSAASALNSEIAPTTLPCNRCAHPIACRHIREFDQVTDRVGDIAALLACRDARLSDHRWSAPCWPARRGSGSTSIGRPVPGPSRSPARNRLRRSRRRSGVTGDVAACGQRPGEQGRIVEFASDLQRALCAIHPLTDVHIQHGLIAECPRLHRRCDVDVLVVVGQDDVEPRQAFQDAASGQPHRPQRRRQRQSLLGVVVFQVPAERTAQVVRFEFGPVDALPIVSAGRLVQQRGDRCVVIPMAGPDGIGFAGFAELLQRVLAHGLE